jgi:zinc-ribbon domain
MYCPKCGANQSDEMRFCNLCGANLNAVRQVVDTRETGEKEEKFDWSKTWVAEMFISEDERKRRKAEMERQQGITPEVKRSNEVKGGIITSFAGIGLMVFLYVFMQGIIKSGVVPEHVAEILSRVWVAGVFPFFVGIGLVINGLAVSKRSGKVDARELPARPDAPESDVERHSLRSADTTEFITPGFSVTEETTKHLRSSGQKR